jgi:hypothetical protein
MPRSSPVKISDLRTSYRLLNNAEGNGGMSFSVTPDGSTRSLSFIVAFADLEAFLVELAGEPVLIGSGIVRTLPLQYPYNENLYFLRASGRAVGSDAAVSIDRPWAYVIVQAEFSTLTFDPRNSDQPYLARRVSGAAEMITVPGHTYEFTTSGEKIDQDIAKHCGAKTVELTRFELPDWNAFEVLADSLAGKVNSVTMTIKGKSYAPGYILFGTYSLDEQQSVLGTPKCQGSLAFSYRSVPWNSGITSAGVVDTITPPIYETADLNVLLAG